MGPHTSQEVAHRDDDAPSPGVGAALLGRHAGGSARGSLFRQLMALLEHKTAFARSVSTGVDA